MEFNRPKRRKDKYNPYSRCEQNGNYYISFKDGQGNLHELKISEQLFNAFDSFELEDLKYLNIWDRHLEHSEVYEATLDKRTFFKQESIEDSVLKDIQITRLHIAISTLPEMQKRRLLLYFFADLTYEQIGKIEGCSKVAVKYAVDKALETLREKLR